MIDTHTHLYMPDSYPGSEADAAVNNAIDAGVSTMIMPNVDTASIFPLEELRAKYPDNIYICMGLHPTEVTDSWRKDLDIIHSHLHSPGVVGIGEVGIDLYWEQEKRDAQIEAFSIQLGWASKYSLPVVIHQRAALPDTLDVIRRCKTDYIPAMVFHCFTEGIESVRQIRSTVPDAYFGIGGVCTFKNAPALREALHEIGIDHIVLETDAPYLAPVPHRGSRNESSYIPIIARTVATELNLPLETIISATETNTYRLFPTMSKMRKPA